jgi:hypothetical protein
MNDTAFPVGTFTLTATLPPNTQVAAGTDYNVTGLTTVTFTTTANGTHNIVINLANTAGGAGGTSTLMVSFNTAGASNYPAGTNLPFSISTSPVTNSTNTLNDTAFPVGTFTLTATLPANTEIVAGTDYTVTGTNTVTFTTTNGGNVTLVINLANSAGPVGGISTLTVGFDVSTASNFPAGTNIPFSISTTPPTNSTNSYNDTAFPAGTFTLVATLPANTQVAAGTGYNVTGTNTVTFTTTSGGTLSLTINIGNSGAGGASTLNLSFDPTASSNFPVGTNIPFNINTTPATSGTNTLSDTAFPVGSFIVTATLPANTQLIAGTNYTVTSATTASFTTTNGGTLNLVLNIGNTTPGGGGGGRNLPPIITFLQGQQTITSLAVTIGVPVVVTVIATDERGQGVTLNLDQDPSTGKNPPAAFNVLNQGQSTVTGTLTWAPGSDSIGVNGFIFVASNGTNQTTSTLPITVNNIIGGGGGGGGGGSSGGNITGGGTILGEKFNRCKYADNETESVVYLCMLGVIDGPSDAKDYYGKSKEMKFFGKSPIDRAEFTKIMVNIAYEESAIERIAKLIIQNNYYSFPDVEPIAWFARYISVAALDKHVHGYPHNGLFIPWNNIEISEAAKILFNTASHDNVKIAKDLEKATQDVKEPWFMRFALLAYAYGGFTPNLDQEPGLIYSKTLTRQQAADMIYTTILNAGIQPKGKLSQLKQEATSLHEGQKQL